MRKAFLFFAISSLPLLNLVEARPLELIPDNAKSDSSFNFSWRSDLWSTPNHSKDTPVRIYDVQSYNPFLKTENQTPFFNGGIEGLSSGKADLVIGKGRVLIGSDLRQQHAGLGIEGQLSEARWFSFSATYQSDSDEPFHQNRSSWTELLGTYAFARSGNSQWVLLLNYSKNRGYLNNQTIPLIGLIFAAAPDLIITVGLPFIKVVHRGAVWNSVIAVTATGLRAETMRSLSPKVELLGHTGYATRAYLHENRTEDDLRLFYEEKFLDVGFKTKLSDETSLEFLFGGSYNRNFYEGKQVYEASGGRTKLQDDLYARIQFEVHP